MTNQYFSFFFGKVHDEGRKGRYVAELMEGWKEERKGEKGKRERRERKDRGGICLLGFDNIV